MRRGLCVQPGRNRPTRQPILKPKQVLNCPEVKMRSRPVRPNIYLPVVRFGVADSDWFSILLISCFCYLAPVPFGVTLLYVPLQMWTWLLATAGAIAFFNYIRIGRRPYWLQHQIRALFVTHRQYRNIPNSKRSKFQRPWITDQAPEVGATASSSANVNSVLFQQNNCILEAYEERWITGWVTTN